MPVLTLNATADSYVNYQTAYQNTNYGGSSELRFRPVGWGKQELFLMFDLSVISPSFVISSVVLQVYQTTWANVRTMNIYRAAASWGEMSVTWANSPGVTGNLMGSISTTNNVNVYLQSGGLNLNEFASLVSSNNGLRVIAITDQDTNSNSSIFSSREGGYAPQLVITYTVKNPQMAFAGAIGI